MSIDCPSADLLKCGLCCTEFPLSDIVVFIQHKSKPCKSDLDENGLRCSSCSETFSSAHSLLRHAQFTHKINIFIEKNSPNDINTANSKNINNNNIINNKSENENFIDVIPPSSNLNTFSLIEKQLFDITVSSSPSSSSSSVSSQNSNEIANEKTIISSINSNNSIINNKSSNTNKTECISQHLVYQNESTSSSSTSMSTSSSSSSIDLSSIKYENNIADKFCASSPLQNDYSKQQPQPNHHHHYHHQQHRLSEHSDIPESIVDMNSLEGHAAINRRTKSVSYSSDEKRKEKKPKQTASFYCDICHAAFNQKIHLTKHSAKHTGIKPFKCSECNYSTVERSHLKVHVRVHTGEKPFKCSFCEYATAQSSTLKIHKKRHHSLSLLTAVNDAKHQNTSKFPIYTNNGDLNNSNGFKYEPIVAENKFISINNNDKQSFQAFSKRGRFELNSKLKDQKNNSEVINQEKNFKKDVMIISFDKNAIQTLNNSENNDFNNPCEININNMADSNETVFFPKQMSGSENKLIENKLLGLANIALLQRGTN